MRRSLVILLSLLSLAPSLVAQQQRLASDFEIARMERQLVRSKDFEGQLSGRLNLGDVRAARNELSLARAEYAKAYELAARERVDARRSSSLSRYANATSYAALAQAKLGGESRSFELLEEAVRYASDDAETWNLYASAMRILGLPRKAIRAARNAVSVARGPLDLAVYQHALATALIDAGETAEGERLLVAVTTALRSDEFAPLRRQAAEQEAFEIFSSAQGDVAAYVSLSNRSQLRLASLYEKRGQVEAARAQYRRVLEGRSDDVSALAALARLAPAGAERDRLYNEAFQANPLSLALVREYRAYLTTHPDAAPGTDMQRALQQLQRGETRTARVTLDALLARFPENETLRVLRREAEARGIGALPSPEPAATELRSLIDGYDRLTPEQHAQLNAMTFASVAALDGQPGTTFASGTIEGVPFRFPGPIIFNGTFDVRARLTYHILGVGENDALLLEPLRLENLP